MEEIMQKLETQVNNKIGRLYRKWCAKEVEDY